MDRKYEKKRNERRLCGNVRPLFLFFIVFYSSLEESVFFGLYAKRGSWNRKKVQLKMKRLWFIKK